MYVELVTKTLGVGKYEGLTSEEIVAAIARHGIIKEDKGKLVKYLMAQKHVSPLDMINFGFEIETSRAIGRQILRHASIKPQEHCITGDSLITTIQKSGRVTKVSIKDLYTRYTSSYWKRSDNLIRVYDEQNKCFINTKIKEVFKNGIQDVYEVKLSNGKSIKSTLSHKFYDYINQEFRKLKDIRVGDFLGTNGIPVYQSYDWLKAKKQECIENKQGLLFIANEANCSYHTIRKWLRIHDLSFSKSEVAQYNQIWNKGLGSELQPNFRRIVSEQTREKLRKSFNENSLKNIKPKTQNRSFDLRCRDFSRKYKNELKLIQNNKCAITQKELDSNCEVDHILPISLFPDKAFDKTNLQVVTKEAHNIKSQKERLEIRLTVRYSCVESITYIGKEETYDLEVEHESHNYIANGIVVHNSQRYSDRVQFEQIEIRKEHPTNRQSSTEVFNPQVEYFLPHGAGEIESDAQFAINEVLELVEEVYKGLINAGVAKECARMILPECTTTTMTFNGTLRSWLSFLNVRMDHHAQKECREIAELIGNILEKEMPSVFSKINWKEGMFL